MRPAFNSICCLLGLGLLAACSTPPSGAGPGAGVPAQATTPPPPGVPAPAAATIVGTQDASVLLDNFTAYVSAVDGHEVEGGRKSWDTPVRIAAGRRCLRVEFVRGVFVARTSVWLEALPNIAYQLRYSSDAQFYGNHSYCDFWIVNTATGETVVPPARATIGASRRVD